MNLAVDVVDAVACGMIVAGKFPESYGAELFGIGALFFVMLGATGLRSI